MPYVGGLCRGDTPLEEISTLGASGRLGKFNDPTVRRLLDETSFPSPYYTDETKPFVQRDRTMALDVVRPEDVPRGVQRYAKDYDRSLITDDLLRARPTLAHPITGCIAPMPWKHMEKPQLPDIPKARAETHYPPVPSSRPRDLSLTTGDIDDARPRRCGLNCEGRQRADCTVDPTNPFYALPASENEPPAPQFSVREQALGRTLAGRDALDISDIRGARPGPAVPVRSAYGNTMRCEDEFRSKGRQAAHEAALSLGRTPACQQGMVSSRGTGDAFHPAPPFSVREEAHGRTPRSGRSAALTPTREGPQKSGRSNCGLSPRYRLPVAGGGAPGTSLHALYAEERSAIGDKHARLATEVQVVGEIEGSAPRTKIRDNGAPFFSLHQQDIEGTSSMFKVGSLPHTVYGPPGNRPTKSVSLDASDIKGAHADTLTREPACYAKGGQSRYARERWGGESARTPRGQAPRWHESAIPCERGS